jgi:hypothetical protein
MRRSSFLLAACLGLAVAVPAAAITNPATFQVKLFRVAVSNSGDCGDPIVIYAPAQASYVDLMAAPTLGQAHLDDGTYKCLMFEMAPSIIFSPATTDGACTAGQPYTMSLCDEGIVVDAADGGSMSADAGAGTPVRMLDGSATTCGATDRVVLYLSQWSSGATSTAKPFNPFQPPTAPGDADHGVILVGALEVAAGGSQVGTLLVGVSGNVYSAGATCAMYPPKIGFESVMPGADASGAPPKK